MIEVAYYPSENLSSSSSSSPSFTCGDSSSSSSSSSSSTTTNNSPLVVPRDIINKYYVERNENNQSIEDLLRLKIDSSVVENEAFYIIDLSTVIKKYNEWVSHLPRVKPYYAIKCNPNTAIIKLLASLGTNFDCASRTEIQQILGCGIDPSRIIYANPCKMKIPY